MNNMEYSSTSLDLAQKLDSKDELFSFRDKFIDDDPKTIYLDGNSLGRLPKDSISNMNQVIQNEWGKDLIRSWPNHWMDRSKDLGAKIAKLVGAKSSEIIISDSTSVNLYKLVIAALRMRKGRNKIISDVLNFPSDLYILQGIIDLLGNRHELVLLDSENDISIEDPVIKTAINQSTALVTLSHVTFKSAFMYDMQQVTKWAHEQGSLILWDLSHSVGAVPIELNKCDVDLAVGCTYKYLNGGPGSPAFLYVREDLQKELTSPIWGWFGDQKPFEFNLNFKADLGINRFAVGTPPILSISAIEPSLDLHIRAGMDIIREKSINQTEYLIYLVKEWLVPLGFTLGSPENPGQRGSHVAVKHEHGYQICQAMIQSEPPEVRIIPDFRTPDNIRLGIAPLYTTYENIYKALCRMKEIVEEELYKKYPKEIRGVT